VGRARETAISLALPNNRNIILAATYQEICNGQHISWFCDLYREWAGRLKPTLRQVHIAGERLFVDFAGHTMEVIDAATGEIQRAEIFVAVLGASSFIYAEATGSQGLADWIGAHVNALNAIGGVPHQIVSDNLKSGITKACFYEPTVNRTYADMMAFRSRLLANGPKRRHGGALPHRDHPGASIQTA
jgi:transposase